MSTTTSTAEPNRKQWKEIRALKWDKAFWLQAFVYLLDGTLPDHMRKGAVSRFKRHVKWFSIDPKKNVIVLQTDQRTYRVIRADEVEGILERAWSDPKLAAYRGVHSLYDRLARETIGISKSMVRRFLANQELQQLDLRSMPGLKRRVVKPLRPERPFQWWQIDLIDMSDYAHWNNKAHFVLMVIDIFSKFLYARPLKTKEAKYVSDALQEIFLADGAPAILQSDNGKEFVAGEIDELAKRWNIQIRHSLPYKPSTQGAVERVNQTIKRMISKFMIDNKTKRYIDTLQFLVYSYNTTQHSTTKHTPFEVHRGRDAALSVLPSEHESEKQPADEANEKEDDEKEETDREDRSHSRTKRKRKRRHADDQDEGEKEDEDKPKEHRRHRHKPRRSRTPASSTSSSADSDSDNEQVDDESDVSAEETERSDDDEESAGETETDEVINPESYLQTEKEEKAKVVEEVKQSINRNADKMVQRSAEKAAKEQQTQKAGKDEKKRKKKQTKSPLTRTLHVGDAVRLNTLALKSKRRRCATAIGKCDEPAWTEKIYYVAKRFKPSKLRPLDPEQFHIADEQGKSPEHSKRRYFRRDLLYVNTRTLERHEPRKKEDLHFGARFDPEAHIRGLAKRPSVPREPKEQDEGESESDSDQEKPLRPRDRQPNRRFANFYM